MSCLIAKGAKFFFFSIIRNVLKNRAYERKSLTDYHVSSSVLYYLEPTV